MKQQTMPVGSIPSVVVEAVHGDLRLAGWDRSEILAKTDGEKLTLTAEGDQVLIACDESLILYLPRQAKVSLDRVAADATLQALQGPLVMGTVEGDLAVTDLDRVSLEGVSGDASFRNVGALDVQKIAGDLSLRGSRGSCSISVVKGDASLHEISGPVTMNTIHSDLTLSKVRGEVEVSESVGGDASVRDVEGGVHLKHVGSDLYLRMCAGRWRRVPGQMRPCICSRCRAWSTASMPAETCSCACRLRRMHNSTSPAVRPRRFRWIFLGRPARKGKACRK